MLAVVAARNDMLDPDSSHMECVDLDTHLSFVKADHIGCSPSELVVQASHRRAGQRDDLAEILDASSSVPLDWGWGSRIVVVMQRAEGMHWPDSGNTLACVDTAAEGDPCTDHSTADESSLGLPSAAFANA